MTQTPPSPPPGDRLAKVIARAGLASRRDAERMITEGRVTVNGKPVTSPALNVAPRDRVAVDGKPLPQADAARVWLYHKPAGLVTTERDEKDRETVFDALRDRLGRVLSVGRLDLTSEGLLLLTNDGALKRRLELPETGWLRRYRVRVNGTPDETALQRLRDGIEVDGETFQGMQVNFDRQQGANAWLTVGLREGRNREIRRAAEAVGLKVNRLIRVSYGPFQLGKLPVGEVEEVKPRVLRDQLSQIFDGDFAEARREGEPAQGGARPPRKDRPGGPRSAGSRTTSPRMGDGRKGEGFKRDNDKRDGRKGDPPREAPLSKSEKKAALRADSSFSLRKGKRGKGATSRKPGGKPGPKPRTRG